MGHSTVNQTGVGVRPGMTLLRRPSTTILLVLQTLAPQPDTSSPGTTRYAYGPSPDESIPSLRILRYFP